MTHEGEKNKGNFHRFSLVLRKVRLEISKRNFKITFFVITNFVFNL